MINLRALVAAMGSGSSVASVTISYTASSQQAGGGATITFSGVAIGTAGADRRVVVGVTGGDLIRTISSVTIGGTNATAHVTDAGTARTTAIYSAAVASGTTADIVVTWSGGQSTGTGIAVWAIYGASATAAATDTDHTSASPINLSVVCPDGGVVVGHIHAQNYPTIGWSGITKDFENNIAGGADHSGAHDAFATGQTVNVAITQAGGPNSAVLCAFEPA